MATVALDCAKDGRPAAYLVRSRSADETLFIRKVDGARWDPRRGAWVLPLDTDLDALRRRVAVVFEDGARKWYERHAAKLAELRCLHQAQDAEIRFGEGLDPYQRVGVKFLATAGSAILADDLGLGKTAQAIRACLEVGAQRVLVVTKKSLLAQWEREITRWAGTSLVGRLVAASKEVPAAAWVVANYEAVVRHVNRLMAAGFDVLIADEATSLKNRKAQRTKAVYKLAKVIPHRFLLTGTPVHNRPDELWSLLHVVAPDRFTSYWRWVERHCETWPNPWGGVDILGVKDQKVLARDLYPYLLRRTKDLLSLPPLSGETVYVDPSPEQRRIHTELKHYLMASVGAHLVVTPDVLSQLTRLRQVCCTPALVGGKDDSAKTDALLELVEEQAPHHKVLIFTTYAQYVYNLLPKLAAYNPAHVTGDLPASRRDAEVTRFRDDPTCRVLVGTITAMGEGLNLQAADVVVFANKEWVPAWNEQAVGRAYRRGQNKPVHVVNLVCAGTVEERVERLLAAKEGIVREVDLAARLLAEFRLKGE